PCRRAGTGRELPLIAPYGSPLSRGPQDLRKIYSARIVNDDVKKPRRQPVETARPKTRAYVIHPVSRGDSAAMARVQARLDEAVGLAAAIELTVLGKEV